MNKKIGVLLVSTNKYNIFLQPLIKSIDEKFFTDDKIEIYLFTDRKNDIKHSDRISIVEIPIEHKPFPYPTLMRYSFFTSITDKIDCDYIFYMDVDMDIVGTVGEEILPTELEKIVAVIHPGFYHGGGSWETRKESTSYTENPKRYYAGGVQGGITTEYLKVCKELADNINIDGKNGIIPIHNDESAWNSFLNKNEGFKKLTPSYCMVEEVYKRRKWKINHLKPKIIALAKDHNAMRY